MAEQFGWKPQGTRKPSGFGLFRKWPGSYDTSDGQRVARSDASNLALAIQKALLSESFDNLVASMEAQMKEEVRSQVSPELFAAFSIEFDSSIFKEFGLFCDEGSFIIE